MKSLCCPARRKQPGRTMTLDARRPVRCRPSLVLSTSTRCGLLLVTPTRRRGASCSSAEAPTTTTATAHEPSWRTPRRRPDPQDAEEPPRARDLPPAVLRPDRRDRDLLPVPVLLGRPLVLHARGEALPDAHPVLPDAPDV